MLNNFFTGTIQKQFSKCTIAVLSRPQHPMQKEASQGTQSHMEVWDLGAGLIKAVSTESTLGVSVITWTSLWVTQPKDSALGWEGEPRPRRVLQLRTSAGSVGRCTALFKTSVKYQCYDSFRMFSPAPFRTGKSTRALVRTGSLKKSNFECHRYI